MRIVSQSIWFLFIYLIATALQAESAYVNDRLFLGVYAEPNNEQNAIHTMASGTLVEILERRDEYVKVRTPEGIEGWARARFVSAQKPGSLRVQEIEAEREQLSRQLAGRPTQQAFDSLKNQLNSAQNTIKTLQGQLNRAGTAVDDQKATIQAELEQARERIQALEIEREKLRQTPIEAPVVVPTPQTQSAALAPQLNLKWFALMIAAFLVLGFFLGSMMMAYRVRKRFNGVKIW